MFVFLSSLYLLSSYLFTAWAECKYFFLKSVDSGPIPFILWSFNARLNQLYLLKLFEESFDLCPRSIIHFKKTIIPGFFRSSHVVKKITHYLGRNVWARVDCGCEHPGIKPCREYMPFFEQGLSHMHLGTGVNPWSKEINPCVPR